MGLRIGTQSSLPHRRDDRNIESWVVKRFIQPLRLRGQQYQMHKDVCVDEDEEDRREEEEGAQGQIDTEERQLDRILEKEIRVRHRARGNREIEQNEQIREPQGTANRCCVFDGLLDRIQIVGLFAAHLRRGARSARMDHPHHNSPPGSKLSASAEAVHFTTNRARHQTRAPNQ